MKKIEFTNILLKTGANMLNTPENLFEQMESFEIISIEDKFMFLANCLHETGGFRVFKENLYYTSPKRLISVFPSAFKQKYNPNDYLKNPTKLANLVYDDRKFPKGLGNIKDGDGAKFIGRGAIQITGRSNYAKLSDFTNIDFISNPQMLEKIPYNFISALYFWKKNNLSFKKSLLETRQIITGNHSRNPQGLQDVKRWFNKLISLYKQNI